MIEKSAENLSDRLRRFRNKNNLSVKNVALALNIPTTTYREWENGRKIVGEPYIALAQLFKISVHELITGEIFTDNNVIASLDLVQNEISKIRQHLLSKE